MKAAFVLALFAAVFAVSSAANSGHHKEGEQSAGNLGNEGRVVGALNNLLKGGILSDNSQNTLVHVIHIVHSVSKH
ncbi:uncharacterized protein BYT42DRAFT_611159 [Radiomyces spectabilis]|uniref:uncharacterized protein n=1 Tax=Radiomyces spectabilis TaxID=64574 RepID=UPI00221FE33F|nr:uncharacterized protein BYT42DRAFT_611159 [Radiomyces spectabilis]KAI8388082.1 hypothetical protein BYT42DRAFT_611159 [Radiomyces spectabilis]